MIFKCKTRSLSSETSSQICNRFRETQVSLSINKGDVVLALLHTSMKQTATFNVRSGVFKTYPFSLAIMFPVFLTNFVKKENLHFDSRLLRETYISAT